MTAQGWSRSRMYQETSPPQYCPNQGDQFFHGALDRRGAPCCLAELACQLIALLIQYLCPSPRVLNSPVG